MDLLSIVLNFIGIGPWLYNKFKPLKLKPDVRHISMDRGDWSTEEFYIFLINRTKEPFYDINIISEVADGIDLSFLPLEMDEASMGPISTGLDFMICGETENGKKVFQTVINNISPEETKKIKAYIKIKEPKKEILNLKFKIVGFRREPKSVFKN